MAYKSREIAKLAKAANMRMLRQERADIKSPAYQAVQARLEALGRRSDRATGRRFSETGSFANKNEAAQYEKLLREFLYEHKTSTIRGYKEYRSNVLAGAHEHFNFNELGITDDEYMEIWEALPDKYRDRIYGSDETVEIVSARIRKQRTWEDEDKISIKEMVDAIQASGTIQEAYGALGLTYEDLSTSLGEL